MAESIKLHHLNKDILQTAEEISIEDPEEARDFIKSHLESGDLPVVTIPKEYLQYLKNGLSPHTTWIGEPLIAGTIGRAPYLPPGEERAIVKIQKINPDQIDPRFTGSDHAFHGVVVFKGYIKPDQLQY